MRFPLIRFFLLLSLGLAISLTALAGEVRILVQSSPLAGFRYYAGEPLWPQKPGGTGGSAAAMDGGEAVDARIARLRQHRNPWQRVLIEVFVVL